MLINMLILSLLDNFVFYSSPIFFPLFCPVFPGLLPLSLSCLVCHIVFLILDFSLKKENKNILKFLIILFMLWNTVVFDICLSKMVDAFFTSGTPINTCAFSGLLGRDLGRRRLYI